MCLDNDLYQDSHIPYGVLEVLLYGSGHDAVLTAIHFHEGLSVPRNYAVEDDY